MTAATPPAATPPAAAAPLAVALGEYDIGWHQPERSLRDADALVERAVAAGARLVVLPEMALTGFTMEAEQAVPLDSPAVEALCEVAGRHRAWLVAGVALRETRGDDACLTNAAIAIDPAGRVAAVHRKRRLFAYGREDEHYRAGESSTLVGIDGVRVALFVCYELRFPELFRPIADDADAMLVIANWPAARRAHWDLLLRARAIENQCAVIGVNRTGSGGGLEYDGGSAGWGPWGDALETIAEGPPRIVRVDPGEVARVRARYPFLRDRA